MLNQKIWYLQLPPRLVITTSIGGPNFRYSSLCCLSQELIWHLDHLKLCCGTSCSRGIEAIYVLLTQGKRWYETPRNSLYRLPGIVPCLLRRHVFTLFIFHGAFLAHFDAQQKQGIHYRNSSCIQGDVNLFRDICMCFWKFWLDRFSHSQIPRGPRRSPLPIHGDSILAVDCDSHGTNIRFSRKVGIIQIESLPLFCLLICGKVW